MNETGNRLIPSHAGLMMLLLLSTSCSSINGVKVCGPEFRGAGASGQVVLADGTSAASTSLGISEVREPGRPETEAAAVGIYAQSDFLRTHMIRAELRDTQTPSRLLESYTPPDVLPLPPNLFSFNGPYAWPLPVADGRALLLSGQLVLEIQTDIQNQPLVRIPLSVVSQNDSSWLRELLSGPSPGSTTGEGCG